MLLIRILEIMACSSILVVPKEVLYHDQELFYCHSQEYFKKQAVFVHSHFWIGDGIGLCIYAVYDHPF